MHVVTDESILADLAEIRRLAEAMRRDAAELDGAARAFFDACARRARIARDTAGMREAAD